MPSPQSKCHPLECGDSSPLSEAGRRRPAARSLLFLTLPLLAFYPVALWYFARITDGSDEPYGVIALALAAFFLWRDRAALHPTPAGFYVAAIATATYALAYPNIPPMARALLAIIAVSAAAGIIRANPAAAALLVLSLPLLASIQFYCGYPLRVLVAGFTSGALNLFGLGVVREGTMLEWGGQLIGVDAPCSGVKMLWTGCVLAACLAASTSLSLLRTTFLMALAVTLVIAANIARGFLLFFKESDAVPLPDWTHAAIGIACFLAFAFALTKITSRLSPSTAATAS